MFFVVVWPAHIDDAIYCKASFTKLLTNQISLRVQICLGRLPKGRSDTINRAQLVQYTLLLPLDLPGYMIQNLTDHAGVCDRLRLTQCLQDCLSFQSNNELNERIEIAGVSGFQTFDILFSIVPRYNNGQVLLFCQMPGQQRSCNPSVSILKRVDLCKSMMQPRCNQKLVIAVVCRLQFVKEID